MSSTATAPATPTIVDAQINARGNQVNPQQQLEYIHRAAWKAGMLGAINLLAKVLAARFIVLVAVVGGIMLALPTLSSPDWFKVGILGVYCAGVVLPAVVLAALGR